MSIFYLVITNRNEKERVTDLNGIVFWYFLEADFCCKNVSTKANLLISKICLGVTLINA